MLGAIVVDVLGYSHLKYVRNQSQVTLKDNLEFIMPVETGIIRLLVCLVSTYGSVVYLEPVSFGNTTWKNK